MRVLSRLFRRLFLQNLQTAYDAGVLRLVGPLEVLRHRPVWTRALAAMRQTEWGRLCQAALRRPQQVLDYVSRYTHRVAISTDRLLDMDWGEVRFTYKDYRTDSEQPPKTMRRAAPEFIRRFLLHLRPAGFHRIRYYGFLGARHRREKLARCRQFLGSTGPITMPAAATSPTDYHDRAEALTGTSRRVCPACHQGQMIVIERLVPARSASPIPDTS